jgi:hypothetical protein
MRKDFLPKVLLITATVIFVLFVIGSIQDSQKEIKQTTNGFKN